MKKVTRSFIHSAVLTLAATPAGAEQACPYVDLMPEFSEFVAQTAELPPPERARAFVERFAARHTDYYSERMFGTRDEIVSHAVPLFDPEKTPRLPGTPLVKLDEIVATGRVITADYRRIETTFRTTFPDYQCGTPISFGVSLFQFDGNQSSDAPGKPRMRFGVDMIALLHPAQELPAFFHHELFHIYHAQQIGAAEPPEDEQPLWWALWNEGLASYVSWQLNPTLSSGEIFWVPRDMEAQVQPKLAHAARLMLDDGLDSHDGYARWFQGGEHPPDLPARSGYYLGYLMAKRLDRGDLAALARMPLPQVQREARAFLESLAK